MFDMSTVYAILKLCGLFVIYVVVKVVYEYVYKPMKARYQYGKYPNVHMTKTFIPLLGDISLMLQNDKEKKSKFHHFIDESLESKGYDIRLVVVGSYIFLDLCSIKALDEAEKLIPSKIDRDEAIGLPLADVIGGSFALSQTDEKWTQRRKEMSKLIGINYCSRHIPMMIETLEKNLDACPLDEEIDLTKIASKITFEVITKIFFGKDVTEAMGEMEYVCPSTGQKSMMKFQEFYEKTAASTLDTFINPKGKIFSFLASYNLIEPYKSNARNTNTYFEALVKFLDNFKDEESVYQKLYSSGKFSKIECIRDVILMLFAGSDTSSHAFISSILYLKRNPDKLDKPTKEIEDSRIAKVTELPPELHKSIYDESDYLNYVIKETLRMDSPVVASLPYLAVENCEIAGVKIPKGQPVELNVQSPHYNPDQWHRPEEFLPERFDPQNELFYKPGTNEPRHPKSYHPFTFGLRNCLGQTLARIELKVLLCRFLTKVDFEVKQEQIENEKWRYHILEGRHLYGKITNKK